MAVVHPTAIISGDAVVADDAEIGPFVVIGPNVTVGSGSRIGPYTRIEGPAFIGAGNDFYGHASIGGPPQDVKYRGERTELAIGNDNIFREFVTINRGTAGGGGATTIGGQNFFMAHRRGREDPRQRHDFRGRHGRRGRAEAGMTFLLFSPWSPW